MKSKISNERGGVLLVVLISSMIMGITLGSYLKFTGTQSRSIQKSQAWNAAIPVAEAGVEEGMAHINDSVIGTNFALNGWTVVSNQFQRSGTIEGGRYTVRISPDRFPTIIAVGWASGEKGTNEYRRTVKVTTTQYATGMNGLITKGNLMMNGGTSIDSFDSQDPAYNTLGRYDAAKNKDGAYVASVFGNLTTEVVYGSAGTGPTGTATGTIGDEAWVASNTGIQPGKYANDVNLAFPKVDPPWDWGTGTSLPGGGTVSLTNYYYWSTKITTTNIPIPFPLSGVTTNVSGYITLAYPAYPPVGALPIITNIQYDFQQKKNQPDPLPGSYVGVIRTPPGPYIYYDKITGYTYPTQTYTYSLSATNSSMTSNSYRWIMNANNGKYEATNLRMTGSDKLLVTGTNVILYIRDDFQMMGAGTEIVIAPNASLKIVTGGDVNLAGNGIFNYNLDASKFSLYGMETCHNIAISGNAAFTGVIYAPDADITMNGSGTTEYDVVGAITGKTATLNGHFHFHYDEALGRARILSKYNVASWREI
jgi:choice-of-anchor A domain-containing protein